MAKAVLFKSAKRFHTFHEKLASYGVDCTVLDFEEEDWISFDYTPIDFLIYFPSFNYSSNHPLALSRVHDNLLYISSRFPRLRMFPDPGVIRYYNDKYRQFLFLRGNNFPVPPTVPLYSAAAVTKADQELGYPMVVKNRFGAGGGAVYMVRDKKELTRLYNLSTMNFFSLGAALHFLKMLSRREFYYFLVKEKKLDYPFLSSPLLAQKFIRIDRDLKTVIGNQKVVEGHWRIQAHEKMWKMNIDDGGVGEWSFIPQSAIDLSVKLSRALKASWLNIDLLLSGDRFLVSEFSPVWHHYEYREKPSFVYKDDYNIDPPLEISLDLERIIVESLLPASGEMDSE